MDYDKRNKELTARAKRLLEDGRRITLDYAYTTDIDLVRSPTTRRRDGRHVVRTRYTLPFAPEDTVAGTFVTG
jgi:hypothetical protein